MIDQLRRTAPLLAAAAVVTLAPASARAQEPTSGYRAIQPGDPAVDGSRLAPGTHTLRMVVRQGDQEMELGTITEELRLITEAGAPALERIQTVQTPMMGVGVDSVVVRHPSLAPVRHRSHNDQRVMALDFDGRRVTGSVTRAGGEATPVDAEMDVAIFDSNPFDLVLRSLPLEEGYGVQIPVYLNEMGGKAIMQARVIGSEAADAGGGQTAECWVVEVERDGQTATFWIAKEGRELLMQRVSPAPGVELRLVR